MIADLIQNQFRPSVFCFATAQAKKIYPHYRSTVQDAFSEASKKLPFKVRLIFGRGIDKNVNFIDIDEDFDEKVDEMLLEASLISIRSCYSQSTQDLSAPSHSDLSYNEKVDKYHIIYDRILSTLFSRTRFFPYFFLPDVPTCFLIIVAGKEDLTFPQGVFPTWSIPTLRKIKKTTMLLLPEAQNPKEAEKQKFRKNLVSTLAKWLSTTFITQYSNATAQIENDYIKEWTGFAQALVNFFNARDDPKTSLVMLKAYADLKAQQGNYKEAEIAYRKVCTNIKQDDDKEMLSESLFLLGCVQIIESRNPLFFVDYLNKNSQGEALLNELRKSNPINFNNVDLKETVSIFSSARKHALMLKKNDQAFLCALLEFEVRRVLKAAPYRAFMFIISTNIGKDAIKIQNNPEIQFVSGFNTNIKASSNSIVNSNTNINSNTISFLDTDPNSNSNTNIDPTPNSILDDNLNSDSNTDSNLRLSQIPQTNLNSNWKSTTNLNVNLRSISNTNSHSTTNISLDLNDNLIMNSNSILNAGSNPSLNSNSNLSLNNHATNSNSFVSLNGQMRRRCAPSSFSLCLGSAAFPIRYHARGILRTVLPFLLEMTSLYSRRRKQALFLSLAAHAFLIRGKRIISSNNDNGTGAANNTSDSDLSGIEDDNFGGYLDPFFAASMLSDAAELLHNEKWPLIQQTVSLRAIAINENLVELLVSVVGSRKLMLPDQTIKITSAFTHGEMQQEDDDQTATSKNEKNFSQIENENSQKVTSIYSNSSLASSFLLALPCGFIEAYVSDVYSHGFERSPPPSMRNNNEWFSLSERMFGSFNRGAFFSQLFRHTITSSVNASGSGGGTRNLNSSTIYSGPNNRLRCECCVGEEVRIKIALKMRNIRYDLFSFSLLVNEFPLNAETGAANTATDEDTNKKGHEVSVVKSSLNVKASKFCFIECYLQPKRPGRFEVYGVKFEWGNVTHLECPFNGQDPVIIMALPEYAAPRISLQVLPKQRLIPQDEYDQAKAIKVEFESPKIQRKMIGPSSSSYSLSKPSRRVLIPGQILPLTVRLTNTCGYDLESLSMLAYTSGPIECVLIEPQITGVFGRYSFPPLKSGTSITIDVAIHTLHDDQIEKDPTIVNNGHRDDARLLLLFPFWTSPAPSSTAEVFSPVPRFDFVELEFDVVGRRKKKKGGNNTADDDTVENNESTRFLRSKSNSSIISKLRSRGSPAEQKPPKPKRVKEHPLLGLSIDHNGSSVSILCPKSTFALGFSPFDNQIIQNHTIINDGNSATLNIASLKQDANENRLVKLPPFCNPFVPKEKVAFWFSDNESVFYCLVEEEMKYKKKDKSNPNNNNRNQQKRFGLKMTNFDDTDNSNENLLDFVGSGLFSFLGGVEVLASFSSKEMKFNSFCSKLKIEVKNVSGVDLNDVCVEIVQKKSDEFVQLILCGKLKNSTKLLKNNDSIMFDLNSLMFSESCKLKVSFISDKIKTLLPIDVI